MKAYLAIKYHADHRNQAAIQGISAALALAGWDTFCVARDLEKWGSVTFTPEKLMQVSFQAIDSCDVLVVELTEKGVGLGIEAGYAHARGIPIITIARQGSDISDTLWGISQQVVFYRHFDDLSTIMNSE